MYWIGPGKRTDDRNRAFTLYGVWGVGVIAFGAIGIKVFGTSSEGLTNLAYTTLLLVVVAAYSVWRPRHDTSRGLGAVFNPGQARQPGHSGRPHLTLLGGTPPTPTRPGIVPAVYTPVPVQPDAGMAAVPPHDEAFIPPA